MKLYNTLQKKLIEVKPSKDNTVRIYSCGPTVYDHAHIGNLSAYIFADTLGKSLRLAGYKTKHVMNYTDVDDKTIKRSHDMYPEMDPNESLKKLTEHYIELFLTDIKDIGIDVDKFTFIKATESIEAMKHLIAKLYDADMAYVTDDGIYFSIEKYIASGKNYGQLLEITPQNTGEARIQNDEYDKESVHDFAHWKKQKDGEPAWDFALGKHSLKGRPGWHIECSAMSQQELGIPFDIHTGGIDLIFPHHENEIAQSTAVGNNTIMANIFAHNNHVLVDGRKMAKSANNFYTLKDIKDKGYEPLAFRLMILQSHYRSESNFSWENIESAQNRLHSLRSMADTQWQATDNQQEAPVFTVIKEKLMEYSQNDLDTPSILSEISKLTKIVETNGVTAEGLGDFIEVLNTIDSILGLDLAKQPDITNEQKNLLKQRAVARSNKDWSESDALREQLQEEGIQVRDTDHGQIWSRLPNQVSL
jgi:cysteinyl-tRNA synthetase